MCTHDKCDNEAVYEVFWPGKTVQHCQIHAEMARATANAMGFQLDIRPLPAALSKFGEKIDPNSLGE
jgi:hypothetical protein